MQEHSLLRGELRVLASDLRSSERDVLAAVGVIWGFLALHPPHGGDRWSWWAAPLFAILGMARAWTIRTHMSATEDYIKLLEQKLRGESFLGYQAFFSSSPRHSKIHAVRLFWLTLVGCTFVVAAYKLFSN
jgi:hypothetical protein